MTNKERRLEFHKILTNIPRVKKVYAQTPSDIEMEYPAIRYKRHRANVNYADDDLYTVRVGYQVIIIDADVDSEIPAAVSALPYSRFESHYTVNNLNHDVYNVFY